MEEIFKIGHINKLNKFFYIRKYKNLNKKKNRKINNIKNKNKNNKLIDKILQIFNKSI